MIAEEDRKHQEAVRNAYREFFKGNAGKDFLGYISDNRASYLEQAEGSQDPQTAHALLMKAHSMKTVAEYIARMTTPPKP